MEREDEGMITREMIGWEKRLTTVKDKRKTEL